MFLHFPLEQLVADLGFQQLFSCKNTWNHCYSHATPSLLSSEPHQRLWVASDSDLGGSKTSKMWKTMKKYLKHLKIDETNANPPPPLHPINPPSYTPPPPPQLIPTHPLPPSPTYALPRQTYSFHPPPPYLKIHTITSMMTLSLSIQTKLNTNIVNRSCLFLRSNVTRQ